VKKQQVVNEEKKNRNRTQKMRKDEGSDVLDAGKQRGAVPVRSGWKVRRWL
jgi:hypothetical protein